MIERCDLEDWLPLDKARELVDAFSGDPSTYPDYEFFSHNRGVYKDISEEYIPLLLLSESLPHVQALRLSTDSFPGHDGVLLLDDESTISVQVTVSQEHDDGYKARHSLRDIGEYIPDGGAGDTQGVIAQRTQRILDAIQDKESKFRAGTNVLLVVDESISWGDVIDPGLPDALDVALHMMPGSKYASTYVIFGTDVRKVR